MLRILYLLSLLLCINLSFCYNYLDEDIENNLDNVRQNERREKVRSRKKPYVRKSPIRQEDDYDRSPIQFDVASFIQPEEGNSDKDETAMKHRNTKRKYTQKPYDMGSILKTDDNKKMEKNSDYMNMADINQQLPKDLMTSKHFNYNLDGLNGGKYGHAKFRNIYKDDLMMNHNIHKQDKKCSLKTLKFPFFSHNKSEPLKPKKYKKRFFFFNNVNKKEMVNIPDFNKISDDPNKLSYKIKRSYEQRLCPACKKIFIAQHQNRCKKNPKQLIHNSRQFFQFYNTITEATLKDEHKDHGVRRTRSENKTKSKREENDRQMKELEEVQKKIDNVEISLPQFEMPTPAEKMDSDNK